MGSKRWLIVFLIVGTAAVFRFQHIMSVPPGLYPDEAMNGNNAIQALEAGDYKVFYPENNGREGLFINLQAQSVRVFGNKPWALRAVSALLGILTVGGLYLLTQQLFNWQIAAMSSFMLAISFWHTLFSRIGFRAIMAPFLLVWGMYFLWRGLSSGRLMNFAISAVFWGLGFYTYLAFRAMPLMLILTLLAYQQAIKKDFDHEKYTHTRNLVIRGLALFMVILILVALPIGYYFYTHPADFLGRTGQLSVFASKTPFQSLAANAAKTLAMFNFVGDFNWRHNFAAEPLLFWPIGALFAFGFLRSWVKLIGNYKRHGHFSTVQTFLLAWFFVGLLPAIISNEGIPHALRAIIVAPVVFIFAGEGLWWFYDKIKDWYHVKEVLAANTYQPRFNEGTLVATLAVVLFLAAVMVFEYDKYFYRWALNPNVPPAFSTRYLGLGDYLNQLPPEIKKYVLVNIGGVPVNDIPMPAQTVMFITDTYTTEKQKARNIYYLTEDQYRKGEYDKAGVLLPLERIEE